ncbi:MAG: GNAT family N-acetyltransferase [Evtepia gabavorous]
MGEWEDRSWAGIDRTDHTMMGLFSAASPDFRAPGGESFPEVRRRGVAAILDIASKHPNQSVAVFAHGTFIRNTVAEFLGIGPEGMKKMGHSDNTAVTLLEITDGKVKAVYMDDNSHLTPEISTLAQQHWWKKGDQRADVNLWFAPFDLTQEADRVFYQTCREEAWQEPLRPLGPLQRHRVSGRCLCQLARRPPQPVHGHGGQPPGGPAPAGPQPGRPGEKGYVSFLYLTPEQRHNGVGVQLIGKAVSLYRPLGRERLQLSCSEANQPALSFYEKYGFRRTGATAGAYGRLYEMEKYIGYDDQGALD